MTGRGHAIQTARLTTPHTVCSRSPRPAPAYVAPTPPTPGTVARKAGV
jgi:hypothetical protein